MRAGAERTQFEMRLGIGAFESRRKREFFFETTIQTNGEHRVEARVGTATRGEQDAPSVRSPIQNSVGDGMPGQTFGNAATSRHDEHIDVTIVFSGESNLRSVRGKTRVRFTSGTRS